MNKKSFVYLQNYFSVFFLAYTISIITKFLFFFYLNNYFSDLSFSDGIYAIFWGYKFDFAMSAIIALLSTFFYFKRRVFSVVTAFMLVALFVTQMGDILYFHDASRHVGYEISDIINDAGSLFLTAYTQHTFLTLFTLLFAICLYILFFKVLSRLQEEKFTKVYFFKKFLLIALSVFFIRGMTQHIPLNSWQASKIGNTKEASLALNASYNLLFTLASQGNKLKARELPEQATKDSIEALGHLYKPTLGNKNLPLIRTKPNIVFLFLESWSAANMHSYGYSKETTPFYDALLKKSLHPHFMVAGGHRTTEGIFTTVTSFQNPLGKSVAKSQLQEYKYNSIIDILKKRNYTTAFFQGSSKETSGTGSFAQSLGFVQSYGKRDVKKRKYEENAWGVQDSDLYEFVQTKLGKELKEPFVIGINGATTHDDKIPREIKEIDFLKDKSKNAFLNALHFSDASLATFVKETEEKYPNTIFVLFADHCGAGISDSMQNYMIPLAFYSKNFITPKSSEVIVSQRDIAPTLYDLAIGNYKNDKQAFSGKSLLQDRDFFADYYSNGIIGWIEGKDLIELNIVTNKKRCFRVKDFAKKEQVCEVKYTLLQENALAFFRLSQKLLFLGKTKMIKEYREDYR